MGTQSHCPVSLPSFSELLLSIGSPSIRPLSPPGDLTSAHGRRKKRKNVHAEGESHRRATTIGTLPDNVLLEMFDFYRKSHDYILRLVWNWHILVHVCRRWRQIILESPHRLNLQILCTYGTPVRGNLDIWPAFPIILDYGHPWCTSKSIDEDNLEDNIIAALEHPDRISYVRFYVTGLQLEKMATVMQEPFPVLTRLDIFSEDENTLVLPSEFLGASAPCLQVIYLRGIPFPTLPTLLLSAGDLVELILRNIPSAGYISPVTMVASLAALPRLETFAITFQPSTSLPDLTRPPPVTRTVLPSLTSFEFRGASKYLDDLVARIDGPQLNRIFINYLNQLEDFQVSELSRFIERSVGPKFTLIRRAEVRFFSHWVAFDMHRHAFQPFSDWLSVKTVISCEGIDWQVSHIAQVLSHFSATLSNVAHLRLELEPAGRQLENTDEVEWLHLIHQFSTVQTLHVSRALARQVALSLENTTGDSEMVAEVLPSLDLIRLVDQPASSTEKFVAARRLSARPLTVASTKMEFDQQLKSYVSQDNDPLELRTL